MVTFTSFSVLRLEHCLLQLFTHVLDNLLLKKQLGASVNCRICSAIGLHYPGVLSACGGPKLPSKHRFPWDALNEQLSNSPHGQKVRGRKKRE